MSDTAQIEELEFDATDRPAAGAACAACRTAGHFCPAKGYRGEDALCIACGRDEQCDQAGAVERVLADVGWDDMQIDPRGLHGECRQIAIKEADRVVAETSQVTNAWSIKASLNAANLVKMRRVRPDKVKPVRVKSEARLERERNAGRRRRMSEEMAVTETVRLSEASQIVIAPPAERLRTKEAIAKALELRPSLSASKIAVIVGRSQPVVSKWFREADAGGARKLVVAKAKPAKRLEVLPPPVVVEQSAPELVTVRLPAAAMDKLFTLLPTKVKVSAVEHLMRELAGA